MAFSGRILTAFVVMACMAFAGCSAASGQKESTAAAGTRHMAPTKTPAGGEDARTPGEWLAFYMKSFRRKNAEWLQTVRDPARFSRWCSEDGDELDYLKRCFVLTYQSGIRMVGPGITDSAARRRCVQFFADWMKRRGNAMLAKLVEGEGLSPQERPYEPLLKAVAVWRATRGLKSGCRGYLDIIPPKKREQYSQLDRATIRYVERLRRGLDSALRKGYLGEKLTRADIEALRASCMIGQLQNLGNLIHFGHSAEMMPYAFPSGSELTMDFRFMRLEEALASPYYVDEFPHTPLIVFEPEVVIDALCRFPDWTAATGPDGNRYTVPAPLPPPEEDDDGYVRLSSFRGRKPFAYFGGDSADDCWTPIKWGAYEGLYQAYKDRVAFFFVDVTIGESALSAANYFGPPMDYSRLGTVGKELCGHPYSYEEHARTAKLQYMGKPYTSFPCLLDTMGNTFHYSIGVMMGGAGSFHVVGKDGRIVHACSFPGQIGIGFGYHGQILNLNAAERVLHAVVSAGGKVTPEVLELAGEARLATRCELSGRRRVSFKGAGVILKSLDAADKKLLATWPKDRAVSGFRRPSGNGRFEQIVLRYDERTQFLEYKTARPVGPDYLRPGDVLGVLGWHLDEEPGQIHMTHCYVPERKGRRTGYLGPSLRYWLSARVAAVDPAKGTLSIRPILEPDKMKGYQFWRQAGSRATAWGEAEQNLDRLKKDLARFAEEKVWVLTLRQDADVFLNADWSSLADLKEGDFVHVAYDPQQLDADAPPLVCVRATRLERPGE